MTPTTKAADRDEQQAEYPNPEYVHELPDTERKRRESPWDYESWGDVDLDAATCKSHVGSENGSLACHARGCPGEERVELLGQPVDFEPGHPGDFCEEYQCVGCGRTGKMYVEHYPVANEYSTSPEFDTRTKYTGILRS
jgi:hypothetical protein